ncbi:GH36-type glycosyl hydrolase domain-containing protein [Metabacillus dongyingensis]|uniref:GH36-type glycosyl hydrolase domain-containing protein n=1 Tax=Metabacillus dongyingensis TaxID=2874282 RepID=UPI001CBEE95A|nr:cellobiose phosphorylase [Metabacillus dongyingensis]UAL53242.1 cellobiose phosphorylase [Metabacillus dongyingensis]
MTMMTDSTFEIKAGDFCFSFFNSGDLRLAAHKDTMINQWIANPIDGSLNNLYLRLHKENEIEFFPLIGVQSNSTVSFSDSEVIWEGKAEQVSYQVTFHLTKRGIWYWNIDLDGHDVSADVVYGQDIGIADKGAVRTNEAYLSQYIDHRAFEHDRLGYVVCSRQNQPQSSGFPYIQQGALTKAAGYSTDGFQFYGLSYKEKNIPEALLKKNLANEVYQYEFAYTALQSERVTLEGKAQVVFYGLFKENHPEAVAVLEYSNEAEDAWNEYRTESRKQSQSIEKVSISSDIGTPLKTLSMSLEEINQFFPNRHQEEWEGDTLLSFFTDTHEHIVLKEKEMLVERPHGHILMTGNNDKVSEHILTTSSFMYGVFNSQLVIGNTSYNKMLTNTRNALNVMKTSGQRIYAEIEGVYQLLTMPSLFEMGFNYARWYYKLEKDMLIITNFTTVDSPEVHLHVRSLNGSAYRYLVTNQVSMNNNEYETSFKMVKDGQTLTFHADAASDSAGVYPELKYRLHLDGANAVIKDESTLAQNAEPHSASLVVMELSASNEWTIRITGHLNGEERSSSLLDAEQEIERYRTFYKGVMNGFHLSMPGGESEEVEKVNDLAWWYTHNMLVHYSVPHGLEQYGGAAWGTRDVCQGPAEYFMATQNYDSVREMIKIVYSHQYEDDGNWPQWFMFDNYFKIQHGESHGDIIVWPLKVLGDYLAVTKDYSILTEKVPYTIRGSFQFTDGEKTILEHANKEIDYIKEHFLHDTCLSSYGDGDWDDTLQPANASLKKYMVSSWTVALTYQVISQFSQCLREVDEKEAESLLNLAAGIKADFNKYMLQTDVIPGFIYMEKMGEEELMLHPDDTKTGISYRLLPMTRSMISELLTPEQAEAHYKLIKRELYCPDGVRLMNRPAKYAGGVSTHFKRAEQAANFGREVGLQYVHAHIRYVEAMAKLGKVDEVWDGLSIINPVGIIQSVPNAERRQSNAYFSSSDGKFNTRYEAQERFNELRDGTAPVKGGWRIYSSGPGIYMNQLISNCLGIRQFQGDLIIDPVIPQRLDGLKFQFEYMGRQITFNYHIKGKKLSHVLINGNEIEGEVLKNQYRAGGLRISRDELEKGLEHHTAEIEIFM